MSKGITKALDRSIAEQKQWVAKWRQPSELLLFEVTRAIDNLFCKELFNPPQEDETGRKADSLRTWGTNQALRMVMPDMLLSEPFRIAPTNDVGSGQSDELLFQAGILERATILNGWIQEGLVTARMRSAPGPLPGGTKRILVVKTKDPSLFGEAVGRTHLRWLSDRVVEFDAGKERGLETRHRAITPELERRVSEFRGWGMAYSSTREIDDHFLEWGQLYLRRMWSQDLLDTDDTIGGQVFSEYLGVLAALSGRSQKHLCFASLLKHRNPSLELRNLLTSFAPEPSLIVELATTLDADTVQIQKLLEPLTLSPLNIEAHLASSETAWAPLIRASFDYYILPLYGLEINPFLFLLKDLRSRFPHDWSLAANKREARWLRDLRAIFGGERWTLVEGTPKLRHKGRDVTDIDFAALDTETNQLALFQLKWQHPVGTDNRARRSAGKSLLTEGRRWVSAVQDWISIYGVEELGRRLGLRTSSDVHVEIFVLARYNAYFSGYMDKSGDATWADWSHLVKARLLNPGASPQLLAKQLRDEVAEILKTATESYLFPIGDLAVILNPTSEPPR